MDSNANNFFTSIETENNSLQELVTNTENENLHLSKNVAELEKALEKQRKFHRKFAEDVVATEKIRIQDFNEKKRSWTERNKRLTQELRQITKDFTFYKSAYEELATEVTPACSSQPEQKLSPRSSLSSSASPLSVRSTKSTATSTMNDTRVLQSNSSECIHKSSKILSKISEKLLLDNKRLKMKLDNLGGIIRGLKAKNQRLENFKKRIENKKLKFSQETDELENIIESTKTK